MGLKWAFEVVRVWRKFGIKLKLGNLKSGVTVLVSQKQSENSVTQTFMSLQDVFGVLSRGTEED